MFNAHDVIHRWLINRARNIIPPHVAAAVRQVDRYDDAESQRFVDWSQEDLEKFAELVDQQRLEFSSEDKHSNVRSAIARYLETKVAPHVSDPTIHKLATRLRDARQSGSILYNAKKQKFITIWDTKAGLPLLCPDDAREEAMRVQRRVVPAVMQSLKQKGARAYSCVFTVPNSPHGELRKGMRALSRKFTALIRKAKRDDSLPILGAYVVMEAPLGGHRDWHPHLNVILVTRGWFDYAKLRALWFANVHVELLAGTETSIADALREIIKYSVRAVPEKSHEKAQAAYDATNSKANSSAAQRLGRANTQQDGRYRVDPETDLGRDAHRPPAPSMTEWTAAEFVEWWNAHRRFRRSRGYGCLYRLDDPEPESLDGYTSVGAVKREGSQLVRRFHLLEFIPGDKSSMANQFDMRERLKMHLKRLQGDPNKHTHALDVMKEAIKIWPTMQKSMH